MVTQMFELIFNNTRFTVRGSRLCLCPRRRALTPAADPAPRGQQTAKAQNNSRVNPEFRWS